MDRERGVTIAPASQDLDGRATYRVNGFGNSPIRPCLSRSRPDEAQQMEVDFLRRELAKLKAERDIQKKKMVAARSVFEQGHDDVGFSKDHGERSVVAATVVDRQFTADRPNQKWVAEFTYNWKGEGWLYVAAMNQLFSRRVVG